MQNFAQLVDPKMLWPPFTSSRRLIEAPLTVVLRQGPAAAVASKNLDAKNFLLALLEAWKKGRKVKVARVELYYGRVHLATTKTNAFSPPSVIFH